MENCAILARVLHFSFIMVQTGSKRYPAGEHSVLPRSAACISFDSGEHGSPLRFRIFQPFDNEKSLSTRGIFDYSLGISYFLARSLSATPLVVGSLTAFHTLDSTRNRQYGLRTALQSSAPTLSQVVRSAAVRPRHTPAPRRTRSQQSAPRIPDS